MDKAYNKSVTLFQLLKDKTSKMINRHIQHHWDSFINRKLEIIHET